MPVEFWGATAQPGFLLPQRPLIATVLLLLYFLSTVFLIYTQRKPLLKLGSRKWLVTTLLAVAGIVLSQLFIIPLTAESQLPPLVSTQNPRVTIALFAAVPMFLAGASLGIGPALLVGLCTGFGKAIWGTHYLFEPFYFALTAAFAGWWFTQNYEGRVYEWLRLPIVTGPLSLVLPLLAFLPAFYAYASVDATWLAALDWSLSATWAQLLPLVVEGLVAGLVVTVVVLGVPQIRIVPKTFQQPPHQRSVRNRLLVTFAMFAVLFSAVLLSVVFSLSVSVAERLSVNQMAHDAEAVSRQIPTFRTQTQNMLRQYSDSPVLLEDDEEAIEEYLGQLVRTAGAYYRHVVFVDAAGEVAAFYPNHDEDEEVALTPFEAGAVSDALARGAPSMSPAQNVDGEAMLSIIVPVRDDDGDPAAALVGRIPGIVLQDLVVGLQGTVGEGTGYIVDERGQIIAHADEAALMTPWSPPAEGTRARRFRVDGPGEAYESLSSETNARLLNYERLGPDHPWRVVIAVPHQVVLRLALQISSPLIAVLAVGMLAFGFVLLYLGRGITTPLGELVEASQQLAAGDFDVSVPTRGRDVHETDEVGQLSHAFERMRRSMQSHFNDMNLMLEVSHDISSTIDIQQGLPVILRGAVRGTGAIGVRAIVRNPSGPHPLTFGEGPASSSMAPFDRHIFTLGRQESEIGLTTPEQVRNGLRLEPDEEPPVQALVAMALVAKDRFQGVLWVGYRQSHEFGDSELNMLRTMANQASVLVENARLFSTAESQWRRLAAVIASTRDAVIVTDQTDRVLLLNPAMAKAFDLKPKEVLRRPVADVVENENLVRALTAREDRVRNLEISISDGRILYASVSTIRSNDQQGLGRVAVLRDITHLKELDDMKSEFVSTVSHDLRSPLTFMRGYLTMLPMVGDINEKQEEYLERILSGVQQMSRLVEDLLDLGRIEAGVLLMKDHIDAKDLLESVIQETAGHAATQGLRLILDVDDHVPDVYGDASLVRHAITNLVSNACKYAPNTGTVTLRARQKGNELVFSVQDHGPGIDPQEHVRIFERFYRIKTKDNSNIKGSGLGLAIVKSIAERHGGRAWCVSQPGKGSTFFVALPLEGRARSDREQSQ